MTLDVSVITCRWWTDSSDMNSRSVRLQEQPQHPIPKNERKKVIGQPVESFSNNVGVDRTIKEACSIGGDLLPSFQRMFLQLPTDKDMLLLAEFIIDSYHERNIAAATKQAYITSLVYLSRYLGHKKTFTEMTAPQDIIGYLNSIKRPIEADPDQRWVSTYNLNASVCLKFFKWLTQRDLPSSERKLSQVPMLKGLKFVKRKGPKTHVKPTDLWTQEDDGIFIKYCEDPRIVCYHMMARDTSARPGELLQVKIGDIKIKRVVGSSSKMFAEVEIGRYGKTKKSRIVPLISSLPYLRAWLVQHPQAGNPNAYLFISYENGAQYHNRPLLPASLFGIYADLKNRHFPALLDRPDVQPPEDKIKIRELLKKPWNPYIRRHTGLTEKARLVNEYTLREHAGWTKTSNMIEVYTHELGGESSEDLLLAYGIDVKSSKDDLQRQALLQAKPCPHCSEPNKPDAKFCLSCKMVLTLDEYNETIQDAEKAKQDLQAMKARLESIERTEEVREEEMRRRIEDTNQRLAQFTAGWTDEMREIYGMLHRLTEKKLRINQIPNQ